MSIVLNLTAFTLQKNVKAKVLNYDVDGKVITMEIGADKIIMTLPVASSDGTDGDIVGKTVSITPDGSLSFTAPTTESTTKTRQSGASIHDLKSIRAGL